LVVDSKSILNSEGAHAVPITSYSFYEGAQRHSSGNATETNGINFGESVRHRVDEKNEFRVDYVGNNPFQQTNLPLIVDDSSKSQLIVKFILFYLSKSEGAQAAPNHSSSQLIVASINSEISFHSCKDCRIFREGEWEWDVKDDGDAVIKEQSANENYNWDSCRSVKADLKAISETRSIPIQHLHPLFG
jgi:hypothetical protein